MSYYYATPKIDSLNITWILCYIIFLFIIMLTLILFAKNLLVKNEKNILINLESRYYYRKRRTKFIKLLLSKIYNSKRGILFYEFFTSEIFSKKNILSIGAGIIFTAFYLILIFNYPFIEEEKKLAEKTIVVIFLFIQLILSGILESRINSQNWYFYKSMPVSFIKIFIANYIPYFIFASLIDFIIIAIISIATRKILTWLLLITDMLFIPLIMWNLLFRYIGRKILGMILFSIIFLIYTSLRILTPYLCFVLFSIYSVFLIKYNQF